MKVVFLQEVPRVGRKYDVKEVNDGYAVNFLFPRKLARMATPKAMAEIEKHKKEIVIEREVQEDLLNKNLEEIKDKTVTIKAKTDEKGHLFSAIRQKNIIEAMNQEHRVRISEDYIVLEKPLKEIGEFEIPILIKTTKDSGTEKKSFFKLRVEKI
ncbi:MAG: 50S ribosomal protein L9 [Parcubacteria group bacterium GW2011_GWF2_38_8]|nr:MAG: 50S ribosomal protein L9 [Parcubacteria group bacterium GW2011_GWF2_38_8]